jgi:hypothetical protein
LSPYTITNIKLIKNLNIRLEILILVQERAEYILEAIGISEDFLSKTKAAQQLRKGSTNGTT